MYYAGGMTDRDATFKCPSCGALNDAHVSICNLCGAALKTGPARGYPVKPPARPSGAQLQQALQTFRAGLKETLKDLVLEDEELAELHQVHARLGLDEADTRQARIDAFVETANRLIASAPEADHFEQLSSLCHKLSLNVIDPGVDGIMHGILWNSIINDIHAGTLPVLDDDVSNVNLLGDEVAHFESNAELLEERVVNSGWVGGNSGFSFPIARGVRWRVGGTRGRHISEKAIVPVSAGAICLTSERFIFLGNPKPFATPWKKILGVEPYSDGIQVFIQNRAKAPLLRYLDPRDAEIVAGICSHYLA